MNNNTPKLQTFHSLTFHARGMNSRGCEAIATLKPGVTIRVSGGVFENGADGVSTYDVDLLNAERQPLSVKGYRMPMRRVTCDDVTCVMLHVQRARRGHIRNKRQKQQVA